MSEEGKIEKLKEQYIDEILGIVPLSQAVFIVLMSLISDRLLSGASPNFLSAIANIDLKSSLGLDAGRFWEVGLLSIVISFALALLNILILRRALDFSLRQAGLGPVLISWQSAAASRVSTLSEIQKNAIQNSFKNEIDLRLRKYKAKRISTELISSIASVSFYSTLFLVYCSYKNADSLIWSFTETLFLCGTILLSLLLHRSSVRYAIAKVLPLKIYLCVITGELVFFETITS
ncbi:hypothetical protein CLU90_4846 [Janthinobacterium sp. 67]|uniref:hypothetical protein n=1 Tax=Janthinobacterium sp. 67 TaxID=2035207 RepID=UPI000CA8CE28|nr:hypothetical protein [Janthinobacterium sp. 67]PJJ21555.1 hypothetical protein CLU90_4846 [Janthinobacterium sp. 67]